MDNNTSSAIKTVSTVLGLAITAATTISGLFESCQTNARLTAESQSNIREIYFNQLYGGKIGLRQELQIFKLLAKLESDVSFMEWAKGELAIKADSVKDLDSANKKLSKRIADLERAKTTASDTSTAVIEKNKAEIFQKKEVLQSNLKKLGDPLPITANIVFHPFTLVAKTAEGAYLEGAKVNVLTSDGEFEYGKGVTNSNGRVVIQLPFGAFRVKVRKEGYAEINKQLPFYSQRVGSINEYIMAGL